MPLCVTFDTNDIRLLDYNYNIMYTDVVIKFPRSRGVSGDLYLQSAIAGVMAGLGMNSVGLPSVSDVENSGLARQDPVNRVRLGTKQH